MNFFSASLSEGFHKAQKTGPCPVIKYPQNKRLTAKAGANIERFVSNAKTFWNKNLQKFQHVGKQLFKTNKVSTSISKNEYLVQPLPDGITKIPCIIHLAHDKFHHFQPWRYEIPNHRGQAMEFVHCFFSVFDVCSSFIVYCLLFIVSSPHYCIVSLLHWFIISLIHR